MRGDNGLLRFARNDVASTEYVSAFSRRDAPEVCKKSFALEIRGRRERRVLAAPAVSCAKVCKKTHTSIQVQTEHSGVPCAMVLRLMPSSPRRRIRLASVAAGLMARFARLGFANLRQLDASHGRQDHTVLPYAASRVSLNRLRPKPDFGGSRGFAGHWHRSSARCVRSRTKARPANTTTRPTLPRPPHPAPTFVTMANAPLPGRDGRSCSGDLGARRRSIFLQSRLDR